MKCTLKLRTSTLLAAAIASWLGASVSGCAQQLPRETSDKTAATTAPSTSEGIAISNDAPNVLTYHNDNARSGQYLTETALTHASVTSSTFGRVAFLRVRGLVDAEPLYVANLKVRSATHKVKVVFVATEHDLVYAFDADTYVPLWRVSLLGTGETTSDNRHCQQITPEIGITSTPVIDLKAGPHGAIYVVAMSKDHNGHYFHRLQALDITTGSEFRGSPQTIAATYPASSDARTDGKLTFDPKQYKERAALLLANGVIYTTWSSHCDNDPYNGWIIGYNSSTLQQTTVFNVTPNGNGGTTWMSGNGPAVDAEGNIYLLTANATFDTTLDSHGFPNRRDFGNAFVKLVSGPHSISVADYFTPHDTVAESNKDDDLGSGGVLLLPDVKDKTGHIRHLAIAAGKDKTLYAVDRDAMGKFNATDDKIYQELYGVLGGSEFGSPAYFNARVYYGGSLAPIKLFPIGNAYIGGSASSQTAVSFHYPGTTPSVSANASSDGIVWAVESRRELRNSDSVLGILHAYDVADLSRELYASDSRIKRDRFEGNKFITPMIAEGKVYVGTPTGVVVFGLLKKLRKH